MPTTLLASFATPAVADAAVQEIESMGFLPADISVVTRSSDPMKTTAPSTGEAIAGGATSGAVTGGALGGLAGLLAGAGVFPALAGLLIGGPIAVALGLTGVAATAVSGAVTGAVAGGLIGALVNLGLPEEEAAAYNKTVEAGGVVVSLIVDDMKKEAVRQVLTNHQAERITEINPKPAAAM